MRDVDGSNGLPVSLANAPDTVATGTITTTDIVVAAPAGGGALVSGASTAGSLVAVQSLGGDCAWNVQITGLTSGTLYFEGSLDSTTGTDGNWIAVNGRQTGIVNTVLGFVSTTNGIFRGNTSGLKWFRVRSVGALTGTPAIQIRLSDGIGAIFLNASIPAGTNNIGSVNLVSSQGSAAAVGQAITATVADTPGVAATTSGSGQAIASVATAGNSTFHIVATAFVGTFVFEASLNAGVNYAPVMAIREDGTGAESSTAISTAAAFIRTYTVGLPGFTHFRVRCSAFTSGTAAVLITQGPFLIETNPSLAASSSVIGQVVNVRPTAATVASVTAASASTTLLASNPLRKSGAVWNDGGTTLYIHMGGGTASATAFTVKVPSGGFYEFPFPATTGLITGFWDATASGSARVTEYT